MPSKAMTAIVKPVEATADGAGQPALTGALIMARFYRMLAFRPLSWCAPSTDNVVHRAIDALNREQRENRMSTIPRRALLVTDVQNEYVTGNLLIEYPPVETSLANIGRVMDAARLAGMPIVVIQHDAPENSPLFAKGSDGWKLHPVVAYRPRDHHIGKTMASAFTGTDLAQWLSDHDIDTLTVIGYMTHNCDASTIMHASDSGLTVEFVVDASGSVPYENAAGKVSAEEIHRVFSVVLHSSFAAAATTDEWIAAVRENGSVQRDNIYASNRRACGAATLVQAG
jgi:nicotinamidase-related amidase